MNRAVFLDRDGVLIEEKNYLHRLEDVVIFPGASAALKRLADAGFKLLIVSNQSDVGRRYFQMSTAKTLSPTPEIPRRVRVLTDRSTELVYRRTGAKGSTVCL